jgi:peptidoglycan hydrolase-like protein with peptidoglycan-binding domain
LPKKATRRKVDDSWDDQESAEDQPRWYVGMLRKAMRRPKKLIGPMLAGAASLAVVVNALFLQSGPHPAPIFAPRPRPVATSESTGSVVPVLPRPRPVDLEPRTEAVVTAPVTTTVAPRTRADIIADFQRELARRGFYDGVADGVYGAKTDAAIRDFMQVAGLKGEAEPSEVLLQALLRSHARPAATRAGAPGLVVQVSARNDTGTRAVAPMRRVIAVQRALSDFGYGPVSPNGIEDAATVAALQKFERERKLPVTGQISDRLVRELAATTGRPLD